MPAVEGSGSKWNIGIAFAAIYLIWGSTYFFIREALDGFTPMLLGGLRFVSAGILVLGWLAVRGTSVRPGRELRRAAIMGFSLLTIGNGAVVWAEQVLPSGVVAIMVAIVPLWVVVLDRPAWKVSFSGPSTVLGVLAGFGGVLLLFSDRTSGVEGGNGIPAELMGLGLLVFSTFSWAAGSLYGKYDPAQVPSAVSTGWQMLLGGCFMLLAGTLRGEWTMMKWDAIPLHAWYGLAYLVVFGSIIAFSAYVWLLTVCSATQVSTYAYVNPVVAVLLGSWLAQEHISGRELIGLGVILGSVLLINLAKYRRRGNA